MNDVVKATGLSQSTASRHLANLHLAGVASRRKVGAQAMYGISDRTLTEICRTACVSLVAREMDKADVEALAASASQFMPGTEADTAAPSYAALAANHQSAVQA